METRETKQIIRWLRWVFHHFGLAGFRWKVSVSSRCKLSSNPKAWPDAVRLAFGFLDVDRDGFLSASDLLAHVAGEDGLRFGNGRK